MRTPDEIAMTREIELATAQKVLHSVEHVVCTGCALEKPLVVVGHDVVPPMGEVFHAFVDGDGSVQFKRCAAISIRKAVVALYPELAQPVAPRSANNAGVSGLHLVQPADFTQLHRNEPGEPGKEKP